MEGAAALLFSAFQRRILRAMQEKARRNARAIGFHFHMPKHATLNQRGRGKVHQKMQRGVPIYGSSL